MPNPFLEPRHVEIDLKPGLDSSQLDVNRCILRALRGEFSSSFVAIGVGTRVRRSALGGGLLTPPNAAECRALGAGLLTSPKGPTAGLLEPGPPRSGHVQLFIPASRLSPPVPCPLSAGHWPQTTTHCFPATACCLLDISGPRQDPSHAATPKGEVGASREVRSGATDGSRTRRCLSFSSLSTCRATERHRWPRAESATWRSV